MKIRIAIMRNTLKYKDEEMRSRQKYKDEKMRITKAPE